MRRPRRKLEVNTFPFLAVLLCAMGAFILLLMVIDRRAKIVTQNKARDAYMARKLAYEAENQTALQEAKERNDQIKANWQAQKDKIHAELLAEEDALARQITQLLAAMAKTDDALVGEKTKAGSLAQKVNLEDAALKSLQKELVARNDQLERAKQASQGYLKLREQLTRDLVLLEAALRNVQERKSRERPVYSLVPYKGKHGASGKPVYIEVASGTASIHPGPTMLTPATWTPDALRRAIEERTGPLEKEVLRPGLPPVENEKSPYVLFLVRPNGIPIYYESLQALRGYRVDYGYELVEADWVFDFTGDKNAAQPWQNVAKLEIEPSNVTRPAPKGMGPRVLNSGGGPDLGSASGQASSETPGVGGDPRGSGEAGGNGGGGVLGGTSLRPGIATGYTSGSAIDGAGGGPNGQAATGIPGMAGFGPPGNGSGTPGKANGTGQGFGTSGLPGGGQFGQGPGGVAGNAANGSRGGAGTGNAPPELGASPIGMTPGQSPGNGSRIPGNTVGSNGVGLGNGTGVPGGTVNGQSGQLPGSDPGVIASNRVGNAGGYGGASSSGNGSGGNGSGGSPSNAPPAFGSGADGSSGSPGNGIGSGTSQPGLGTPYVADNKVSSPNAGKGSGGQGGGSPSLGYPNGGSGGLPTNLTIDLNGQKPDPSIAPRYQGSPPLSDNPLTFRNVPDAPNSQNPSGLPNNNGAGSSNGAGDPMPPGVGRPRGPGDSDDGREPGPRVGDSPFLPAEKSRSGPRLPALGRITGNRDFVLTVDCFENKVTLTPPGRTFDLSSSDAVEQLATLMKTLVARRQGTVRPGEPPYRPLIHFRVQPDGRRTYYAVYPRLAEFGFPMSRETPE